MKRLAEEQCTVCGACKNICPVNSIEFVEQNGYSEAKIHDERCIKCGKCYKVCPVIKKQYPKAYAAYALDEEILNNSSSGGIASLLAENIVVRGGVVFGAAFDTDFMVHHIAVEAREDLDKIRRSKYVQSRTENSYENVADYLKQNREVLFTGTGCQIAGLYSYLQEKGVDTTYLYTQDMICHGVMLPQVWKKYLTEKETNYQAKIKSVSFRDKKEGWFKFGMKICFENGQTYYSDNKDDLYMKVFLANIALKECCYSCRFRGEERYADVTLADFWSVYRNAPDCFNERGTSVVLVNSQKGEKLLEDIKNHIFIKEVAVHDVTRSETMLVTTVKKHENRKLFLSMLNQASLEQIFQKCTSMRLGVMGSYNSRCIARRCGKLLFQISNTNLVSLFSKTVTGYHLEIKDNTFRDEMLKLDFDKAFIKNFERYIKEIDYFLLDFLEERFGVIAIEDSYVANSDALHDANIFVEEKQEINVYDEEYLKIWKQSCISFINILLAKLYNKKIFLVKMYLSEKDSMGTYFQEINKIRKTNLILEQMYSFFQEQCQKKKLHYEVIEIAPALFYTNNSHIYGCLPEHFNMKAELMGAAVLQGMLAK